MNYTISKNNVCYVENKLCYIIIKLSFAMNTLRYVGNKLFYIIINHIMWKIHRLFLNLFFIPD